MTTKPVHYIYVSPFGPRDYRVFKSEAEAYRYQAGLTMQGRASEFVTTTGNSYDENQSLLREFRAKHAANQRAVDWVAQECSCTCTCGAADRAKHVAQLAAHVAEAVR